MEHFTKKELAEMVVERTEWLEAVNYDICELNANDRPVFLIAYKGKYKREQYKLMNNTKTELIHAIKKMDAVRWDYLTYD
jgi:hypothetical protein